MIEYKLKYQLVTLPKSGVRICISDEGSGDVLLFVHGLSSNLSCWYESINHFKRNYRCIALDLPGHGLSDKGNKTYSVSFFREILEEVVELLRLDKFVLFGHSLGGQVSVKYALNNVSRVKKLVLVAPAGFERYTEKEVKIVTDFTFSQKPEELTDVYLKYLWALNYSDTNHPSAEEDLQLLKEQIKETGAMEYRSMMNKCFVGLLSEPVYEELHMLQMPVLVIFGEGDKLIPNKFLHPLLTTKGVASDGCHRIPECSLEIIENAGHFVQREKAGQFIRAVEHFLNAR